MSSNIFRGFFFVIFLLCIFQLDGAYASLNFLNVQCSNESGTFTDLSSDYPTNLDSSDDPPNLYSFLKMLSSKTSNVSFYALSLGETPNTVSGLFLCRPDQSLEVCTGCIEQASWRIIAKCLDQGEAVILYEECMLRYTKGELSSSILELHPAFYTWSLSNFSDYHKFVVDHEKAIDSLINETAISTRYGYFATKEANISSHQLFYLAQCTPNLKEAQCKRCLRKNLAELYQLSNKSSIFGAAFNPSCQFRYDGKIFYNKTLVSPISLLEKSRPRKGRKTRFSNLMIGVTTASAGVGVLLVIVIWCSLRRRKERRRSENKIREALNSIGEDNTNDIRGMESFQFDFSIIKAVTNNFSRDTILGKGGFGEVFKGHLGNGQEIAVKRLSKNSSQGILEFKNEVLLVAKLQHRNLVKLLGFCTSGDERILIYEFLTNSSLDHFLFEREKRAALDWKIRFRIITGVARGLLYLHEDSRLKIIHRDLKCSNILLDEAMNAKISDFGLARLFDVDQTQGDTKRIAGTFGYMAPEYAMAGQFSVKSDVYSFGVIVLEIISGQRNNFFHREFNEEALLHRAWRLWSEEVIFDLVDPSLNSSFSAEEVKLCTHIGLLCTQEDPLQRPKMALVVSALNGQSIALPLPNSPHYITATGTVMDVTLGEHGSQSGDGSRESEVNQCNQEHTGSDSITELGPR